jgi:hypothetical protein
MAAFQALIVIEDVLIDGLSDPRASDPARGTSDQPAEYRAEEPAQGSADRTTDGTDRATNLSTTQGTGHTSSGTTGRADDATGFLRPIPGGDACGLAVGTLNEHDEFQEVEGGKTEPYWIDGHDSPGLSRMTR